MLIWKRPRKKMKIMASASSCRRIPKRTNHAEGIPLRVARRDDTVGAGAKGNRHDSRERSDQFPGPGVCSGTYGLDPELRSIGTSPGFAPFLAIVVFDRSFFERAGRKQLSPDGFVSGHHVAKCRGELGPAGRPRSPAGTAFAHRVAW